MTKIPEEPDKQPSQPRRWTDHWPILIPIVLIGGLLWVSLWFKQRARMFADGGHVEFEQPTWSWVESLGGEEMRTLIGSPTQLQVPGENPSKSDLKMVSGFSDLWSLSIQGLSDEDLQYVVECEKLEHLYLGNSSITDDGFETIGKLPNLKRLDVVTDQPLTGEAIRHLQNVKDLETLYLHPQHLTNLDLTPLADIRSFEQIGLTRAVIQDDDLSPLAALPGLRWVALCECTISEQALAALQPSLAGPYLNLAGSNITDAHLPAIRKLTWLLGLNLGGTQVSDEACLALKSDQPGTHIRNANEMRVQLPSVSQPEESP